MNSVQQTPSPEVQALVPVWDSTKVRKLIDACETEGGPSTLEVGRLEKRALIHHLSEAFGSESFGERDLYYMGLRVADVDLKNHLAVSGSRRLKAKKRSDDVLESASNAWQFRAK